MSTTPSATTELSTTFDNMLDIVFRFDAQFHCSFISPSVETVLGYHVEDLVGTDMMEPVHPDDVPALAMVMRAAWETTPENPAAESARLELRLVHAVTGETFWGESIYRLLLDDEGRFAGVVVAWRDIGERKRAEMALVQAEARYREVIDVMREIIFQTDLAGNWCLLSPSWTAVTGYAVSESLGQHYLDVVHPEDRQAMQSLGRALIAEQRTAVHESVRIRTKDGKTRWVEINTAVSRERATGKITGGAGTIDDVTARHINDSLEEIGRALDRSVLEGADVDSLAQRVCDGLFAAMKYPLVWVGLKNEDGTVGLVGRAGSRSTAIGDVSIRWDDETTVEGSGPNGRAIRTRETQTAALVDVGALQESHTSSVGGGDDHRPRHHGLERVIVIPLLVRNAALGTLCICTDDTGGFDADHIRALSSFAGRLSMALQLVQHQALLALQAAAMASSANALFITDPNGRIEWVNAAFEQMSVYSKEEAVGRTPSFLGAGLQLPETTADMWNVVKAGGIWRGEILNRRKDGQTYVVAQTVTPLFDEHRTLTHLVAAQEDITARRAAEARANHMAEHDALTDLPNRTLLHKRLRAALEGEREADMTGLALLFLDLDRFKLVNDTLGHDAGDQLLKTVAERIRSCVRAEHDDIVARQGGDEFIVLLAHVTAPENAVQTAQRILESIGRPMNLDGHDVHVTASIGATMSFPGADAESMIKQADAAMYRAKRGGRNGVVCYAADQEERDGATLLPRNLTIQAGLAHALSHNELTLHYQPQVDLMSGRIVGLEALLRWTSPALGAVSPADFIPLAEATGLIVDIDRWVLRAACAQRRAWERAGLDAPRIAVNLSGVSFRRGDLLANVEHALRDAGVSPEHLELELTEGIVMHDAPTVIRTLDALREMGVRVALDDFGTGYSSLSYIKRFKIDALKIDRSFVMGLPHNTGDAAIARLIVSMAGVLGMHTVAEGVETEEQAVFLASIGCTTAQGFFFSRPVAPNTVAEMLSTASARESRKVHSDSEQRTGVGNNGVGVTRASAESHATSA